MNEEVKALRSELALLILQFSESVASVEKQLDTLVIKEQEQAGLFNTEPISATMFRDTAA